MCNDRGRNPATLRNLISLLREGYRLARVRVGLVFLFLAVVALLLAATQRGLVFSLGVVLLGSWLGLIGVGLVSVGMVEGSNSAEKILLAICASFGALLAVAAAVVGFWFESQFATAIGVGILVICSGLIYESTLRDRLPAVAPTLAIIVLLLMPATFALAVHVDQSESFEAGPVVLALLAVLATRSSLVRVASVSPPAALVIAASLAGSGITVLRGGLEVTAAAALFVSYGGGTALSKLTSDRRDSDQESTGFEPISLAISVTLTASLLFGATYLAERTITDRGLAIFVVALSAIVGGYAVWPGEGGLILIAAGFLFAWSAADVDAAATPSAAGDSYMVALGDSFISGEGATAFFGGTNHPGFNTCRRSPTAWPHSLASQLSTADHHVAVVSFACSGARIEHLTSDKQHPMARAVFKPNEPGTFAGTLSQLDALTLWAEHNKGAWEITTTILISAGGNDAGFSDLIKACLVPGATCAEQELIGHFETQADTLQGELSDLLEEIDKLVAGRQTTSNLTVVLNPYLAPFGGETREEEAKPRCGTTGGASLIEPAEVIAVERLRQRINSAIEDSGGTELQHLTVVFNHKGSLVDGDICGDAPRQRWLSIQPPDRAGPGRVLGRFRALVPTATWLQGSAHPTELAHALIADTVRIELDERELLPGDPDADCPPLQDSAICAQSTSGTPDPDGPSQNATNATDDPAEEIDSAIGMRIADAVRALTPAVLLALLAGVIAGATLNLHLPERWRVKATDPTES